MHASGMRTRAENKSSTREGAAPAASIETQEAATASTRSHAPHAAESRPPAAASKSINTTALASSVAGMLRFNAQLARQHDSKTTPSHNNRHHTPALPLTKVIRKQARRGHRLLRAQKRSNPPAARHAPHKTTGHKHLRVRQCAQPTPQRTGIAASSSRPPAELACRHCMRAARTWAPLQQLPP